MSDETHHVHEAVGFLSDFEELSDEEKRGALHHAEAAIQNAMREL